MVAGIVYIVLILYSLTLFFLNMCTVPFFFVLTLFAEVVWHLATGPGICGRATFRSSGACSGFAVSGVDNAVSWDQYCLAFFGCMRVLF